MLGRQIRGQLQLNHQALMAWQLPRRRIWQSLLPSAVGRYPAPTLLQYAQRCIVSGHWHPRHRRKARNHNGSGPLWAGCSARLGPSSKPPLRSTEILCLPGTVELQQVPQPNTGGWGRGAY